MRQIKGIRVSTVFTVEPKANTPYPDQSLFWYPWPTMAWPMIEPTPPPSKLQLLVARTDEGYWTRHRCLLADLCGQSPMWSIYTLEISSALISICRSSTCRGMRFYHPRASPSDEEWPVGWTQPDLLPCKDVSLVIRIGQGLLARWRKSTFGRSLGLMTKGWHQQTIDISQSIG